MKGYVLDFSVHSYSGVISGDDGIRYTFTRAEWKSQGIPSIGAYVDFEVLEGGTEARGVYVVPSAQRSASVSIQFSGSKSKVVAGLLAIFIGTLGIHKFYLGYNTQGLIMLLVSVIGFVLIVPIVIVAIVAIIEGISYITLSDEDFERMHVQGSKPWF